MDAVFPTRRDCPFRLLAAARINGQTELESYLTAVPVRIRGGQVEVCFLTRWDVHIIRLGATGKVVKVQPQPGEPGYKRFRNLKLTLSRDEPVRISREGASPREEVVLRVLNAAQGHVEFAVAGPPGHVIDLCQLDHGQESSLGALLDRLNHGDSWDRVASL
jgi:hypothetical protein